MLHDLVRGGRTGLRPLEAFHDLDIQCDLVGGGRFGGRGAGRPLLAVDVVQGLAVSEAEIPGHLGRRALVQAHAMRAVVVKGVLLILADRIGLLHAFGADVPPLLADLDAK